VFKYFLEFQRLVEHRLDRKIIIVQSNWGEEYERLNSFSATLASPIRSIAPHTHQQNGDAKCKHHHIVDVGLTLLAHASMPMKYWDEAFLAATYLINRTPTKILSHDTPLHKLLGANLNYSSFHVF
jgi:hypothetical protein